jgi:prolyl-tRNA editing enzyme YbaK/EbsC (Cys-tRNA(Pro) deacylase)/ribosomal protein S18 acetylase RimI-like enzyme
MKSEVYDRIMALLRKREVGFREVHHRPTRTSEESAEARGEELRIGGKAILLKVHNSFKLFVFSAARRLDSSKVKRYFMVKRMRFATPEELFELTGLKPGSVPPFGPPILDFELFVDLSITENDRIAFNAGSLTDSIVMDVQDFLKLAEPVIFDFSRSPAGKCGIADHLGSPGMEEKNSEVRLVPAGREDLPMIEDMARETWWHHFPGIISNAQIRYMLDNMYSLGGMEQEMEGGHADYRFIQQGSERVGFCSFGMAENGSGMKIHKLYVLPGYQKRGFGRRALRCIESLCREQGATSLILAVNKGNGAAIHLYRCEGFVIQDSVSVDIGGGFVMDDYLMEKQLV